MLSIFLVVNSYAQKYRTMDIRLKADSILKTYIGDEVFTKYCFYNENSCYEYKDFFGEKLVEDLNKRKRTKGNFLGVEVLWRLSIPCPTCSVLSEINGKMSLVFDSLLQVTKKPNLDFIPDFYWKKDSCNLISKGEALRIASGQKMESDGHSLRAKIIYDGKLKTFTWEVSQTLCIDDLNKEEEFVEIDAITSEVKQHGKRTLKLIRVY